LGQIASWCSLLIGPAFIIQAIHDDHRDRPSLQWPKTSGVIMQCQRWYHGGKHSYYNVEVAYTYLVNGRRYTDRKIALWNPDLRGDSDRTHDFVATHPVHSTAEVYYDPEHPENAVLIPGPDEAGNRTSLWGGGGISVATLLLLVLTRKPLANLKATLQSVEAESRTRGPRGSAGLPHGFASYEPACKRKLGVFPDRESLNEVLGQDDGKPLQEWNPEDRVIDAAGHEFRLVQMPGKKSYDLEPTGESWSYERLLEVALADGRLLKRDPGAMRRQMDAVPAEKQMAVLLKVIDGLPTGPRWVIAGFFLFLLLFFLAVMFGFGALFTWLHR